MKVSREVRGSRGDAPPFKGGRPKREDSHNKASAYKTHLSYPLISARAPTARRAGPINKSPPALRRSRYFCKFFVRIGNNYNIF